MGDTDNCDGARAFASGMFECSDGVTGIAAGGDADDDILPAGPEPRQIAPPRVAGVFAGLHRSGEGTGSAGNDELNVFRTGIECGWALGGVEGGKASAGARAYVDQAAALAESLGDHVDGLGDMGQCLFHSAGDPFVLSINDACNFEGGEGVECGAVLFHCLFLHRSPSLTASWKAGLTCLISCEARSGQVRLVRSVTESCRSASIHKEVPV